MKKLFAFLASLKLSVILLCLLLVGLAAGTILDTRLGAEAAGRLVYYSGWFLALEALFALNVALAIASLFPWARKRTGFLVVHGALLLILAGALTSFALKVEGTLTLAQGDQGSVIVERSGDGLERSRHQLPFQVKLDRFVVDTYPGTMRPSGFTSQVEITDGVRTFPASIWMNHELHYRGFALFQSSYSQEGGRPTSTLSVAKDPGQPLVFLGYYALMAGMVIVVATRIAQARSGAAAQTRAAAILGAKALVGLALLCGLTARADAGLDGLRRIPVQHDGRVMPLDTLARTTVVDVTGGPTWNGEDPVATFTGWLFNPMPSAVAPVVRIGSKSFTAALGFPAGTRFATFLGLAQNPKVVELVGAARQAEAEGRPRQGLLADAEILDQRLTVMQSVLAQQIARPVPVAGNSKAAWGVPAGMAAAAFAQLAAGPRLEGWPSAAQMDTEVLYNHLHPTRWAWIILLASLAASVAAWIRKSPRLDRVAFGLLVAGFAMMTWGIQLRWTAGGRFPAANMYESMLFLAWGVGLFAVAAYAVLRNRLVVINAASMAALAMLLTDLLPMDAFIHPVAPVLAGTPWLAIHVPIIMVSYSILALGLVVAHMQVGFTIFAPARSELTDRMYDLLYWYILVGSTFLIAGIITGSMWAASSWGRYWGWDPKEVWSLVAFLAYMAILHAKLDQQIGKFGVAAISIVAFQTILMTYLGVNFVLNTGMHSYAMGDSPVLPWMIAVALAEGLFLAWGTLAYRRQRATA